jgi:hypothetical protein
LRQLVGWVREEEGEGEGAAVEDEDQDEIPVGLRDGEGVEGEAKEIAGEEEVDDKD